MTGYIGTVVDITSRKLAEQALSENERRMAEDLASMNSLYGLTTRLLDGRKFFNIALEEVLSSAIVLQQADMGSVHLYNPTTETFHVAAQQGFDQALLDQLSGPGFDRTQPAAKRTSSGKRAIIEDVTLDPNYKEFLPVAEAAGYRAIQSTPLQSRTGALLGLLSTHFRQPCKLTSRELRMLDLYARQAADFIERLQLINSMREEDHRKDEFLAMLAHELRDPLAPIRSGLDYLTLDDNQAVAKLSESCATRWNIFVRLVDDLLDVSRIAQARLNFARRLLKSRRLSIGLSIRSPGRSSQRINPSKFRSPRNRFPSMPIRLRLVQVLGNLLNNASKYTPEGGHVELTVRRDGEIISLEVKDNGIGIERELLPCVFDLFTQSSRALDRAQGGMGIGLTLVRSLVELHHGSVSAESRGVGQGSRFTILLPVCGQRPAETPSRPAAPSQNRRILVVDDNYGTARLVCILLKKVGDHQVEMAHDGPSALEKMKSFEPEVVLLDIGLPGMNGYEVARRIRPLLAISRCW